MNEEEIWKPIKGYENIYEVSNFGNVRSVDRYYEQANGKCSKYNHIYKGKELKQYKNNAGYMQVQLSYKYKSIPKRVHKLVAEAFLENPNELKCINHMDGNKCNNNVENLEWCSYSHNNREARRLGLNKGYRGMTYKKRCELAIEYIENFDVFKEFSFPLMKRDEENQVKSSIKYEFDTSIKKGLLEILKGEENE